MRESRVQGLLNELTCGSGETTPRTLELDAGERLHLRRLATGETPEAQPGDRNRATACLGLLSEERNDSIEVLVTVAASDAPIATRVQAVRTLSRMKGPDIQGHLERLARRSDEESALAMAAAHGLVQLGSTRAAEVARALKRRLEEASGGSASASIASLERLVAEAEGRP